MKREKKKEVQEIPKLQGCSSASGTDAIGPLTSRDVRSRIKDKWRSKSGSILCCYGTQVSSPSSQLHIAITKVTTFSQPISYLVHAVTELPANGYLSYLS